MSLGTGPFDSGLMGDPTLVDLESAWLDREAEAVVLSSAGHRALAASLRCYALEVRLKAIICRHLKLA